MSQKIPSQRLFLNGNKTITVAEQWDGTKSYLVKVNAIGGPVSDPCKYIGYDKKEAIRIYQSIKSI